MSKAQRVWSVHGKSMKGGPMQLCVHAPNRKEARKKALKTNQFSSIADIVEETTLH